MCSSACARIKRRATWHCRGIAQLRDLLHPDQIGPLSRLVVLTLQNNMSGDEAILLPEKVADRVMVYARKELGLAPKLGKVGPFW